MSNYKYILSFIGLTNPIKQGQNKNHWENKNKFGVNTLEDVREIVEKYYHITRPDEFESAVIQGFRLLDNPKWKEGRNIRDYGYKLVNNSGNPILILQLQSQADASLIK